MSADLLLLIIRIAIALTLYAFLGAILVVMWRDIQGISERESPARLVSARLIIVEADNSLPLEIGYTLLFQSLATIGRSPTSTLVLPDTFASSDHARITRRVGQWWLDDLDSRNGTTVNGMTIDGAVVLSSNDIIGIGRVKLRFETG
jgi:hypothetical protein